MKKKPSWDDIPSLNLTLEDQNNPSGQDIDKRQAVRMVSRDIMNMLMEAAEVIYVQVANRNGILRKKGILQDINQIGLCFIMPAHGLKEGDALRIGAMLGKRPFKTKAIIRWVTHDKAGIEYVNPKPEDVSFLSEFYSAKILNRT